MILFARVLPLVRILEILDHIFLRGMGGGKGTKTFQKGSFHVC